MMQYEWPAEDYAVGAYIQSTVASSYLKQFKSKSDAHILDIGCGDGSFSLNILEYIPQGQLVGIDASESMLRLARQNSEHYANFSVHNADVLTMSFYNQFDHVVSFWCLQWTSNIVSAYKKIYQALKPGGKVFTLYPSGDDPFMLSFKAVFASGQFQELESFKPPMHYSELDNLANKLSDLSFTTLQVNRPLSSIELPSLEVFRRFVYGIGFFQGQIDESKIVEINEAMVRWYEDYCHKNYGGRYLFEFAPYFVTGEK